MSIVKLYGVSGSRALRSLWAIEEVGIDYEQILVDFKERSKSDEYLEINPNGRIPALVDDDVTIFESMAINLYLAKKYGGELYPSGPRNEALGIQWSIWVISEIEHLQVQCLMQKLFVAEEKRNTKLITSCERQLLRPLAVLDNTLSKTQWLAGENFTIADLNVSSVMLLLHRIEFDYSNFHHLTKWVNQCYDRSALHRAQIKS
jgi:glutathione S-transferase